MSASALLESGMDVYAARRQEPFSPDVLTATILDYLDEQSIISLDGLICLMPQYTWNQIFHRVDQLARCKMIVLRRHRFEYTLCSIHFLA